MSYACADCSNMIHLGTLPVSLPICWESLSRAAGSTESAYACFVMLWLIILSFLIA